MNQQYENLETLFKDAAEEGAILALDFKGEKRNIYVFRYLDGECTRCNFWKVGEKYTVQEYWVEDSGGRTKEDLLESARRKFWEWNQNFVVIPLKKSVCHYFTNPFEMIEL